MKDCRAKKASKPKAVKGAKSLERSHAPAAEDWYEDRAAGSLLREYGVLSREDDYILDGAEMTGQDWTQDENDEEEYDDSFVPEGGFPVEHAAIMSAPANGFDVSGPRIFPTEFDDESSLLYMGQAEDPWVRDGDPWFGSPVGSDASASMVPPSSSGAFLSE